ncbi:MAG TPA: hypothetical protein VD838_13795 [Anaeromyxobacteraceae bacterium]|nr:hypothetical protein [Anaeromyxobacteraceae bacterium]
MPAGLDANAGGAGPGGGMGGAMAGDVPPPAAPTGDQALAWTLPSGWTERRGGGGMRLATLVPPNAGVDVSVIVLPGPAGGELANVNRWRNQIGLPPLDDAALAAARKTTGSPAGPIAVFDFTSEDASKKRVVGGIAEAAGNSWFFKLSGDAAAVEAAKPDFLRLLGSVRR